MKIIEAVSKVGIVFYCLTALLPFLRSDAWWIRAWDFPRLQLLVLGVIFGLGYVLASADGKWFKYGLLTFLVTGFGSDLYRVLPYSPLWPKESKTVPSSDRSREIRLITANVLQSNTDYQKLLAIVREEAPDVILLLEVNDRWLEDLSPLESEYRFHLKHPLENQYGIALYSRLPLENPEVLHRVEPTVPSVYATVVLPSGDKVDLYGLHPKPPLPQGGPTTERDAELVKVATAVNGAAPPVVVFGDLNDVAWSHTTRLFRRISGLLDPRVGRGPFATFPSHLPLLRFPLDYFFHSAELKLIEIKRLPDIGSDHFPMAISFQLDEGATTKQSGPDPDSGDKEEVRKTLRRANGVE